MLNFTGKIRDLIYYSVLTEKSAAILYNLNDRELGKSGSGSYNLYSGMRSGRTLNWTLIQRVR